MTNEEQAKMKMLGAVCTCTQLAHECRGLVHDSVMDCTLLKFE